MASGRGPVPEGERAHRNSSSRGGTTGDENGRRVKGAKAGRNAGRRLESLPHKSRPQAWRPAPQKGAYAAGEAASGADITRYIVTQDLPRQQQILGGE